jgi:hypothetical protein
VELLNVITVTVYTSNRLGGAPEALILVGCLACVMGAVTYGRKKVSVAVKWDKKFEPAWIRKSTTLDLGRIEG